MIIITRSQQNLHKKGYASNLKTFITKK